MRGILGANATGIFAHRHITHPVQTIFNRPVVTPALQDFVEIQLVGCEASTTIYALNTGPLGLEMIDLAFQTQHLAQGGPLQVSLEVGAGPERSFFHATAGLADGLRLA